MKKFLLGLLVGLIIAGLSLVVVGFSLVRLGDKRPSVADGSTLILNLSGDIPEKAPVEIPIPFIGVPTPVTVHELWNALQTASTDSRIKAVLLVTGHMDVGWAKLEELRSDLISFKKSGKPLMAFLRAPRTREYYLASAADRIYVSPEDMVDVKGLRAELMFFKRSLDKLGVEMQVEHVGKYKDAGDMFTQTGMSRESREALDSVLDGIYSSLIQAVASGRKRTPDQVRAVLDNGPYTARQAAAAGLVDALRFEDQVYGELTSLLKQKALQKLTIRDYIQAIEADRNAKRQVALVVGEGTILRGSGSDAMGTDEGFSSGAFIRMLRRVASDPKISGVILRVDSPGGDAFASDEILREVKLLHDKKPLVISMSDAAASGGYYVSMTGDPVVAYPTTLTGSIGVLWGKPNLRGLYDKLGIQKELLTRGKNSDIDTDYQPLTQEARAKLRAGLEEFYTEFVKKVAESRKRSYNEVEPLAQGRVWLGADAKVRGLVDELGGLDKAVELIRRKANIGAGETVRVVPYPAKRSIWEQWMRNTSDTSVDARLHALIGGLDYKLWMRGGTLRVMPYTVDVH